MIEKIKEVLGYCPDTSTFKIDWLTLSFREELHVTAKELLSIVNTILGASNHDWEKVNSGAMPGYNTSYRYHGENYITINFHDTLSKQGVNINVTGFGTLIFGEENLVKLIAYGISSDAYFTRFDVAYDDVDKNLPLSIIDEINKRFEDDSDKYSNLGFSSILTQASLKMFYQGDKSFKYRGRSMSLGSRYSKCMVRIYNKAVEQRIKDKYWYRVELQTKYEVAERLAKSLFNKNLPNEFIELLNQYFRPLDFKSNGKNLSLINTHKKWDNFLIIMKNTPITSLNSYCQNALKQLYSLKYSEPVNQDKYCRPRLGDFYQLLNGYYYYLKNSKIYRELISNYPEFMVDLKFYLEQTDENLKVSSVRYKYFESIIESLI